MPILLTKDYLTFSVMNYVGLVTTAEFESASAKALTRANPLVDLQLETPWTWPQGIQAAYRELFARVPPGVSWLALHFNAPGDIGAVNEEAAIRIGEYEFSAAVRPPS